MDLYQQYQDVLAAIGGLVVALYALITALKTLAGGLSWLARFTVTRWDDDAADGFIRGLESARHLLDLVASKVPRARFGKAVVKPNQ